MAWRCMESGPICMTSTCTPSGSVTRPTRDFETPTVGSATSSPRARRFATLVVDVVRLDSEMRHTGRLIGADRAEARRTCRG